MFVARINGSVSRRCAKPLGRCRQAGRECGRESVRERLNYNIVSIFKFKFMLRFSNLGEKMGAANHSKNNAMEAENHVKHKVQSKSLIRISDLLSGIKIIVFGLCLICCYSCNSPNDGRLVRKFIARMNANEVNAASKYIYPADHASLYFFNEKVLQKTPNIFFNLLEKENVTVDGQKGVVVKIECLNVSQCFVTYMQSLNILDSNKLIVDTIFVRKTGKGDRITFNWAKIRGENLQLASIMKIFKIRFLH